MDDQDIVILWETMKYINTREEDLKLCCVCVCTYKCWCATFIVKREIYTSKPSHALCLGLIIMQRVTIEASSWGAFEKGLALGGWTRLFPV